jgi:hypothetical protein
MRLPSMPSLRQSKPRALPSPVRRSRRIPAKPPSHISSRSKEVLSPIPRCASSWPIDPSAPANGGREEPLHRRADGHLPAGAHFSSSDPRVGTRGFSYFKTPLRFWEHSLSCGARSELTFLPLVGIPTRGSVVPEPVSLSRDLRRNLCSQTRRHGHPICLVPGVGAGRGRSQAGSGGTRRRKGGAADELTSNEFALLQDRMRNVGRLKLISRWGGAPWAARFGSGKSNRFRRSLARASLLRTGEDGIVRVQQKLMGSDGCG